MGKRGSEAQAQAATHEQVCTALPFASTKPLKIEGDSGTNGNMWGDV